MIHAKSGWASPHSTLLAPVGLDWGCKAKPFLSWTGSASSHFANNSLQDLAVLSLGSITLKEWPVWPEAIFLNEGVYSFDKWKCSVHWDSLKQGNSDWRGALNGVFCLNIQYSNYILASGSTLNSGKGKYFFLKRLSGSKVPTFCRRLFPFLVYNDEVIHEFLSGSSVQKNPDNQSQTLSIQLSCGDK